jgi:hypothetical protein
MIAFELDAIVETECSLLPELDGDRHDSVAGTSPMAYFAA